MSIPFHENLSLADYLKKNWPDVARAYTPETLDILDAAYSEPHRKYHSHKHILTLLEKLEKYTGAARKPSRIAHAVLWHDVVYKTYETKDGTNTVHRADSVNVEDSARLFEKHSSSLPWKDRESILLMIRSTSGHVLNLPPDHLDWNDTALFLDLDLSVLALPYEEFSSCTDDIRFEYPHIDDHNFCLGRANFLDSYRLKERLFFHPETSREFDDIARRNMQREAEFLRKRAEEIKPTAPTIPTSQQK